MKTTAALDAALILFAADQAKFADIIDHLKTLAPLDEAQADMVALTAERIAKAGPANARRMDLLASVEIAAGHGADAEEIAADNGIPVEIAAAYLAAAEALVRADAERRSQRQQ